MGNLLPSVSSVRAVDGLVPVRCIHAVASLTCAAPSPASHPSSSVSSAFSVCSRSSLPPLPPPRPHPPEGNRHRSPARLAKGGRPRAPEPRQGPGATPAPGPPMGGATELVWKRNSCAAHCGERGCVAACDASGRACKCDEWHMGLDVCRRTLGSKICVCGEGAR